MFTPGRTPGQLDRRALGQRMLAQFIPQLQSFRFQGGKPMPSTPGLSPGLSPSTPSVPPSALAASPAMPGLSNSLQAPASSPQMDWINNGANYDSAGNLRPFPGAPAPAPAAPQQRSAPRPAPAPAPAPARPAPRPVAPAPVQANPGRDLQDFLRWLAAVDAAGGGAGNGGTGVGANSGGGAQAGGDRDSSVGWA